MHLDYTPPESLAELFRDPRPFNVCIGPIGSSKTTACIMFLLYQALRQEPDRRGVRRTRYAICRNTLVEMRMTVQRDIMTLLGPLIRERSVENVYLLDFPWAGGRVQSEWFFIPLDRPEDQRRLLSTQFSGLWINEAREVPFSTVMPAAGRVGRWPRVADGGCTFPFVLMDSNPPAVGSELWEFLERSPPTARDGRPLLRYVRQPSALSPEADWLQWLRPDYYDTLVAGQSPEWVRVHVLGEYGSDPSGLAVLGGCFRRPVHVSERRVEPSPGAGLILGLDPGLNPAAVLCQLDPSGVWRVFREAYGTSGLTRFVEGTIMPMLAEPLFRGREVTLIVDPAAAQRDGLHGVSALADLRRRFDTRLAATQSIEPRIDALEEVLRGTAGAGGPRMIVDAKGCPMLIRAMETEYVYRRTRLGQYQPLPEKRHPWSDLVDALGYAVVTLGSGAPSRRRRAPLVKEPPSLAWT